MTAVTYTCIELLNPPRIKGRRYSVGVNHRKGLFYIIDPESYMKPLYLHKDMRWLYHRQYWTKSEIDALLETVV